MLKGFGAIGGGPAPWIVVGGIVGGLFGLLVVLDRPVTRNRGRGPRSSRFRRWGSRKA